MLTKTYSRNSQKGRDHLITANVDYVARILSTMSFKIDNQEERENLLSAGVVGLVEAANTYDATMGVEFRTYAYPRIRGAIVDELRRLSPVSQQLLKNIGIMRRAYESLEPPVTTERLSEVSGLTTDQVISCLEAMRFIKPDDWNDLTDVVHGSWRHEYSAPEHALERQEMLQIMAQAIEELPEKERLVLTLYHMEELKLAEISEVIGLSVSRISRILTSAVFHLQEAIRCKTS